MYNTGCIIIKCSVDATASSSSRSARDLRVSEGFSRLFIAHACHCRGQGVKRVQWGLVARHGKQLYAGSKAFISMPEPQMVLIFHDELPRPNERERESEKARESLRNSLP